MLYKKILFGLACGIIFHVSSAFALASVEAPKSSYDNEHHVAPAAPYYDKVVRINVGRNWLKTTVSKTLSSSPFVHMNTADSSSQPVDMVGLFLGFEHWKTPQLGFQAGLGGYLNDSANVSGSMVRQENGVAQSNHFNYRIQSQRLVLEGRILTSFKYKLHPYVSGSLGIASNQSYSYRESTLSANLFTDNNRSAFTYGIGGGVEFDLSRHVRLGAGYQYLHLGSFSLNQSDNHITSQTPMLNNPYGHEVLLQFSMIA
jgi:opacity protein-like surface antigen